VAEVDAFVALVGRTLAHVPDSEPVTARQVRHVVFSRAPLGRRGYDEQDVDAYLATAERLLDEREGRTAEPGSPVQPADPWGLRRTLAEARPRRLRLRRGYLPEEVDAFLARIGRSVATGEAISPAALTDVAFRIVVGGYDEREVDALIDRLSEQLRGPWS
jgi:DivIVA domain-containing protein